MSYNATLPWLYDCFTLQLKASVQPVRQGGYLDPFGTRGNVVVQGTIKISLSEQTAEMKLNSNTIHFDSNTITGRVRMYDSMKGPGYMAVVAGEVVHIIKLYQCK